MLLFFLPVFFFLQEQWQSSGSPSVPPSTSLSPLLSPDHKPPGLRDAPPLVYKISRHVEEFWGRPDGPGVLLGRRGPAGQTAGRREKRWREGAEGGGAELSLPISWRIVPDTRRPCGVSVSGSFAGAVTHARGVELRAGSGQE